MLKELVNDRAFFQKFWVLAIPIFFQTMIQIGLGAVDVFMVGQLNDTSVAAIGLANQVFFLLLLFSFGVSSGASIFSAQAWGSGHVKQIEQSLGLGLVIGLSVASIFAIVTFLTPDGILSLYTNDEAVIELGARYLRIVSVSYIASVITVVFSGILRSIEIVTMPMIVSMISLGLNSFFNYCLIFGEFGLPELGVPGAGIATMAARFLEMALLVTMVYMLRLPIAKPIWAFFQIDVRFARQFLMTTAPVIGTEIAWALGITSYMGIYARIGTESIAAVQIADTISQLAFISFIAIASAATIMIGNRIGASELDLAQTYGYRFLAMQLLVSIGLAVIIFSSRNAIPDFYNISDEAAENTRRILLVISLFLPIRAVNLMQFIGILRSGGDTAVSFLMDVGPLWVIGLPLAWVAAFVWRWPIEYVFALTAVEEVLKMGLAYWRFTSRRWIHALAT